MYNYLKYYEVPTLVVATKVDKIKRGQRVKQTKLIISALDMDPNDELIFFSSETKEGHDAVWRWIEQRSQLTILDETKS
ncbi:GTP-binding protein EngB [Agrilactobacillus composti DSM 18527 = JCM 14202]|nr:GTP-binding protein EngB [Agrilactobacillus composti DSM 18527 = JCM 14202]